MNVLNKCISKTKCVVLSKFDSKANYIINCSFHQRTVMKILTSVLVMN